MYKYNRQETKLYTFLNLKNIKSENKNKSLEINSSMSFIDDIFISYNIEDDIESNNFINIINNGNVFDVLCNVNSIKIKLEDVWVIFYRKNIRGNTSLYFSDLNKKYFMKIPYMYKEYDLLRREVFILKKLEQYDFFPKVVFYNNILLVTEYVGEVIKKDTIPDNILFQINNINNILLKENIIHSDIKQDEMIIKNNKLYLIDFGWARYNNRLSCDNGFCGKVKPYLDNTSDIQMMINIIIKLLNS